MISSACQLLGLLESAAAGLAHLHAEIIGTQVMSDIFVEMNIGL